MAHEIERLGEARIQSPILLGTQSGDLLADYTPDDARVVADVELSKIMASLKRGETPSSFEEAGPRQNIYFDAKKLKVGIVTCGGLCPGLNNIIRGLVMTLHHGYGVSGIYGFKYGFAGLNPKAGHPLMELTPESVRNIHTQGGTMLGTSRGPQPPEVMVDTLEQCNVRLLFAVGGDGTFRGALALHEEIKKRGLKVGIVAIPKTIDNDIPLIDKTFGFDTAVRLAKDAIMAAYYEAQSADRGIGLVKLMGRDSGFIAASATLSARVVNLVLIPELPFTFEGENGLFDYLQGRFKARKSTVIVVAEGAGQDLVSGTGQKDKSGNAKLVDIGSFLKEQITSHFSRTLDVSLKYIDPSYIIRSAPADSNDAIFCGHLAQAAAHAGMSGRTGMAVGSSHGRWTHLPLTELVGNRKQLDPEGPLWLSVLESTGQPFYLTNEPPKNLERLSFVPSSHL
ncbi:MAG: ATP-dependent 6-phosphofructokinase [Myxococcota bacterium]|jgi:6-phosphofructokinase 1|nr:ATP-dependent 6-phosphofructokinase [Myxococcota bacterium]